MLRSPPSPPSQPSSSCSSFLAISSMFSGGQPGISIPRRSPMLESTSLISLSDLRPKFGVRSIRSEEHTSELQSLMRTTYAVFCLKKKKTPTDTQHSTHHSPKCCKYYLYTLK